MLFAWCYVWCAWHISFVFVNFILTLLFSLLGGIPVFFAIKKGNVRNKGVIFCLSLLVGLLMVYSQWAAWCTLVTQHSFRFGIDRTSFEGRASFSWYLAHPQAMVALARIVADTGLWSMGGTPVSGIPLVMVWIAEAGITIGIGTFAMMDQLKFPFSETWQKWLEEERSAVMLKPLSISPAELRSRMEQGHFSIFSNAERAAPGDKFRYELAVYKTPDLNEIYLTLFEVKVENKRGRERKVNKALVKQLVLSRSQFEKLAGMGYFYSPSVASTAMASRPV